ncbi:hypothetical protein Btru_002571 [Bulinus truncatus]|nr:hypothetical protein Btru_002571 [Bulinus truncatus]
MTCYLRTVCLLAVLTVLIPEPCSTRLSKEVSEENCPQLQRTECDRDLRAEDNAHYAVVYSRVFDAKFLCDTKTDGGGWIVIQRRVNKDTDFYNHWARYKSGFGTVCNDYWIGNKYIQRITNSGIYELRIDMLYQNQDYYAQYKDFYVDDEDRNYTLHLSGFFGTARKDDLAEHNGKPFSTPERDNDQSVRNCAREFNTGWWYASCHSANLNGQFDAGRAFGKSVIWESVTTNKGTLDAVEMKIRRRDFNLRR